MISITGENMFNKTSGDKKHYQLNALLPYLPVILAILVMLPRLFFPNFGLFDDGKSIITAQRLAGGDWRFQFDATDARFRPIYWLSFAVIFNLFGEMPFVFFFVNMLALCVTTAALIGFLRRTGAKSLQAGLAGLFFVLSGSVIENYYTLSKGEGLQLFFIALSLWLVTFFQYKSLFRRKALLIAGVSVLLVCAALSKETSNIIFPISAAWFLIGWLWAKRTKGDAIGWRGAYLIASAIAFGCYFLFRSSSIKQAFTLQGYSENFTLTTAQIMASVPRWAGWLTRDFSYLAIAIIILAVLLIGLHQKICNLQILLEMLVWMAAWVVIYLPWHFMAEYYMLPFALGAAVFSGLILGNALWWRRAITCILNVIALALILLTVINNITTAHIQLTVDSVNAQLMETLARLPQNATIYINIQFANEYTDEIPMQLKARFNRSDLNILIFNPSKMDSASCAYSACYIISPGVSNQPLLTVRMGLVEPSQIVWNQTLADYQNEHQGWQKIQQITANFRMFAVDLPRMFCPFIKTHSFCASSAPFIDNRVFTYDWTLYELETP